MRGMIAACYFMALGYAIAKSGADEEIREIASVAYKRLVAHTVVLADHSRLELARQQAREVLETS
jgi:hypothetical protein